MVRRGRVVPALASGVASPAAGTDRPARARELPPKLDVASSRLFADTAILTANDLRFSRDDIARFFDNELSRRELATLATASAGWPIALRIRRNEHLSGQDARTRVLGDVIGNWVETRLWSDFDDSDAEFLRDVGLFDWFDATLLATVLGESDAMQRLEAMRRLDGLLEPVRGGAAGVRQLHPLIRDHCARRTRRDAPLHYRTVHRRIAVALVSRGRTVDAMRHATDANDPALVATILVDAGGVRLAVREGLDRLVAVDRLVRGIDLTEHPRLVPARSVALAVTGNVAEARALFASLPRGVPRSDDREAIDLYLDRSLARAAMAYFGGESAHADETREMLANAPRLAAVPPVDPAVFVAIEFLLCILSNSRAEFDNASNHGRQMRAIPPGLAPSLAPAVDIQFGIIAMAEGRVDDAVSYYSSAQRLARARFFDAPSLMLLVNLMNSELQLERSRIDEAASPPSLNDMEAGATTSAYFAASDIATEMMLDAYGLDAAVNAVAGMLVHARYVDMPALVRHLAASRVSLLVDIGRIQEAEGTWEDAGLPEADVSFWMLRVPDGCGERRCESTSCA